MRFSIYPPIGLARVGNSPASFYVGPEIPGRPGSEIAADGTENSIISYKSSDTEVKRQAARFRIFENVQGGVPKPAQLPLGAQIEWTVHLVNKKAAIVRPSGPPTQPKRPQTAPNSADRLIDAGARTVSGAGASGVKCDQGEFLGRRVPLGELRTDVKQNLLVLGGFGFSSSPANTPLTGFYSNTGWHDDASDGPVTARIHLVDGTIIDDVAPAWVLVGPPDFAPEITGVVTLFDVLLQLGIDHFNVAPPAQVSFTRDVFSILKRTRAYQWVNIDPNWSDVSDDWPALANSSAASAPLRSSQAGVVRNIESILSRYKLTTLQNSFLDKWVAGTFASDWAGEPVPLNVITADGLTRAALDGTVGQGFFPGIEGGIILKDRTLYSGPFDFRLDHAQAQPGDITALMALPWQADFNDCERGWWPSQRPDEVFPNATATDRLNWERGADSYLKMINNFAKLGFITAQKDAQGNVVFAEAQRASSSQFV